MREAGPKMIILRRDEHLTLSGQPPPGTRVLHAVEIAFETEAVWIGCFVARSATRADRTSGPRRHRRVELGFAFLAPPHSPAYERVRAGMRAPDDRFVYLHIP